MHLDAVGLKRVQSVLHCKVIRKYPRIRILLLHFLEMYLTLYQKRHWHGAIQKNREMCIPIQMERTQPLANTKQSSAPGKRPWKEFHPWVQHAVRVQLPGPVLYCPLEVATLWYSCSLLEMGKLKPSPPSLSSSPSSLWLLSILCEGSKHFPGTHALELNILISPRYTTCKCGYTFTFARDIFIDLLGFNLFFA